ncbi:hypothetical protein D3C80_1991790 [compost metagenome]
MYAGRLRARAATSREVMISAAPPATGMTISSTCNGSATFLLASTCSMVRGWPKNIAWSLDWALVRWSTAILAMARGS